MNVRDLLNTKYTGEICRVVAGEKGLKRPVSWVHILEIKDIVQDCVDGNELVLTTGIAFTDKSIAIGFIQDLIERDVAGLCIETALYYHVIDQELIELADKNDFPLIEITGISRFKDIAKGLNRLILEGESASYQSADHYDYKLDEIESKGTLEDGIRYTADYLNIEIAYFPNRGKEFATSDETKQEVQSVIDSMTNNVLSDEIYCKGKIAVKNLNIGNHNYGTLIFKSSTNDITEFDLIILGRLSNRIKGDIIDEIRKNEEALYKESDWIYQWMQGGLSQEELKKHLKEIGVTANHREYCVCSCKAKDNVRFSDFIMDMTLFVRKLFEDEKLFVLGYRKDDHIHYIILNDDNRKDLITKLAGIVKKLRGTSKTLIDYRPAVFSLGKVVHHYSRLERSYKSSLELIDYKEMAADGIIVFDYLYFDRILSQIAQTNMVAEFIEDYLGDLLLPENEDLLLTLETYYKCNCSKQKTAERLYIVRQTLYFRLQKIAELLGEDFTEGEYKYALEFAIRAYRYKEKFYNKNRTESKEGYN